MQSFSKLKGVFPGRVTRKQPEEGADDAQNGSSRSSEQHPSSQQGLPDGLATPGRLHASSPATSAPASAEGPASPAYVPARWTKFQQILSAPVINLSKLQEVRVEAVCLVNWPARAVPVYMLCACFPFVTPSSRNRGTKDLCACLRTSNCYVDRLLRSTSHSRSGKSCPSQLCNKARCLCLLFCTLVDMNVLASCTFTSRALLADRGCVRGRPVQTGLLGCPNISLHALRRSCPARMHASDKAFVQAAWTGVPDHLKPVCWRLLLRYEPPNRERAQSTVRRKRREYQSLVPAYYDISNKDRSDDDIADLKQVRPSLLTRPSRRTGRGTSQGVFASEALTLKRG